MLSAEVVVSEACNTPRGWDDYDTRKADEGARQQGIASCYSGIGTGRRDESRSAPRKE